MFVGDICTVKDEYGLIVISYLITLIIFLCLDNQSKNSEDMHVFFFPFLYVFIFLL
jgi:heme/copper-type cytochrome/quinol oxidase subunit 4